MATEYKIVTLPDTGDTRPSIKCSQCLGIFVTNPHKHELLMSLQITAI